MLRMTTVGDLKKRLAKLEANQGRTAVTFKMPDGSIRRMLNKRLLEVFKESLVDDGVRGRDYETLVSSVGNDFDNRLIDLFLMCVG
jgi:hypothetical protein